MVKDIEGQMTLDIFFADSAPLGWTDESKKGKPIPFQELKDYIGKKVVYVSSNRKKGDEIYWYKVVMIKDYYENCDQYYSAEENGKISYFGKFLLQLATKERKEKAKPAFVCDRIAFSDDNRTLKTNCWLSEAFCSNGRCLIDEDHPICFYEYKAF